MAFNVAYTFTAIDKFSASAKKIKSSMGALNNTVKDVSSNVVASEGKFSKFSGILAKIPSPIKALAAAYLGFAAVVKGFNVAREFEDALLDLSAITGATGDQLEFLKQKSFELGKASAQSGTDVLKAFKLVASAKPELLSNSAALASMTKQVLLLANASGVDLTTASNFAAQSLNIFKQGADQAGRFVNVLAAGAKYGSSEVAETGEALLIAGPAARAAGLSFEQLNAAIQTVALGGIKAQRSGTALNSILMRMQQRGYDFQKLGLQGSFEIVKRKMDALTNSTDRANFAAEIFGQEHAKVGFAILDNVKSLDQFERSLTGTNVAQEQADIRLRSVNARMRSLGAAIQEKLVFAFDRLSPIVSYSLDIFSQLMDSLTPDAIAAMSGALVGLASTLTLVIWPLKWLLKGFIGFFDLLGKLAKLIGLVFAEIATGGKIEFLSEVNHILSGVGQSDGTININLNDPKGAVKSVEANSEGSTDFNLGRNNG